MVRMSTRFRPGNDAQVASDSPNSSFSGIFEDDGDTGYFYAYDRANAESPILDAVHIYNVKDVADRDRDSDAEILWSPDGLKAGLLINGYLHAVLNFEAKKAYCRSNFPPPGGAWAGGTREPWSDLLSNLLR
jgi:hypothetical protein